jgi:hypothetical protein
MFLLLDLEILSLVDPHTADPRPVPHGGDGEDDPRNGARIVILIPGVGTV